MICCVRPDTRLKNPAANENLALLTLPPDFASTKAVQYIRAVATKIDRRE